MGYRKFEKKLHKASANGCLDTVHWCLSVGADVDAADELGKTATYKAANRGKFDCLEALLERGADPNIADHGGRTPLWAAASGGYRECVESLMLRADSNARDITGKNAYLAAVKSCFARKDKPIGWVLRLGEVMGKGLTESDWFDAMRSAAWHGHVELLRALIKPMSSDRLYQKARRLSLMTAALRGEVDCVSALLDESDFDASILDPRDTWACLTKNSAGNQGNYDVVKAIVAFERVISERGELAEAVGACDSPSQLDSQKPLRDSRSMRL